MREVPAAEAAPLAAMAKEIWEEHYTPILGAAQVAYMLNKFQSEQAMAEQMRGGYRYRAFLWDDTPAGYLCYRAADGAMFLSKIYLKKEFRGKKISRYAVDFLRGICRERGLSKIWLTVNRYNEKSLAAYRALGFAVTREQKTDIGGGFFMDDYIMELAAASNT